VKLTALVEHPEHVSCRYRLAAFRADLAAAGHTLDLVPFSKSVFGRLHQYRTMTTSDAVILQRTLLNAFELRMLRRHATRLIFDFDDAIWLRDSYAKTPRSRKRQRRFADVCRTADLVFAGNDWTRHHAAALGATAITVPTCVDVMPSGKPAVALEKGNEITLVWIGSRSTLRSLERLRPTLEAVGRAVPDLKLKLICDTFLRLDSIATEHVAWNRATEADEISSADIGIATMPDDDWSRGKCGLKLLQYMAAGLPVIADPVGVHTAIVRPGVNGALADTAAEWIAAVQSLAEPATRQAMGAAGRAIVAGEYSVAVGARRWCEALARPARRAAC
jgi:glycosyltransferase involved in cell wall biosynthesis